MKRNDPEVVADVRAAFDEYERALLANDNSVLEGFFLADDDTVRYGVADMQQGFSEIRAFRALQKPFDRRLDRLVIATYGRDFAVASTLFHRDDTPSEIGRQTQFWVRTAQGWRIAAAHVSMIPAKS